MIEGIIEEAQKRCAQAELDATAHRNISSPKVTCDGRDGSLTRSDDEEPGGTTVPAPQTNGGGWMTSPMEPVAIHLQKTWRKKQ